MHLPRRRWLAVALSPLTSFAVIVALFLPRTAHAQQNFFNVPASDVTRPGNVFFQEQLNILTSQKKLQSNSHFAYGFAGQLEVGLDVSHVNIEPFSGASCRSTRAIGPRRTARSSSPPRRRRSR